MAAQRLNTTLLRSAFAGKWQMRSFQTLPYTSSRIVQLQQTPVKNTWANLGAINSSLLPSKLQHVIVNTEVSRRWASTSKADIESRVITVCKAFDKITADKLTLESHFINDLGLDSLDHVEVIMAIEDEFGFEIPDDHAEKLLTPNKIVEYVSEHENVTA